MKDGMGVGEEGWLGMIQEDTVQLLQRFAAETAKQVSNTPEEFKRQDLQGPYLLESIAIIKTCIYECRGKLKANEQSYRGKCSFCVYDPCFGEVEYTDAGAASPEVHSLAPPEQADSTLVIQSSGQPLQNEWLKDGENSVLTDPDATKDATKNATTDQIGSIENKQNDRRNLQVTEINLGSLVGNMSSVLKIATMDLSKILHDQNLSSACFLSSDSEKLELIYSKYTESSKGVSQSSIEQLYNLLKKQSIKLTQLSAPKPNTRCDLVILKKSTMGAQDQLIYFETEIITSLGDKDKAPKEKIHMFIYLLHSKQFKRLLAFPNLNQAEPKYNLTDYIRRSPEGCFLALMIEKKKILLMLNYQESEFHNSVGSAIYTITTDHDVIDYQIRERKINTVAEQVFCLLFLEGGTLELRLIDKKDKKEVMKPIKLHLTEDHLFEKKLSSFTSIYLNQVKREKESLLLFGLFQEAEKSDSARVHLYAYQVGVGEPGEPNKAIEQEKDPPVEFEGRSWVSLPLERALEPRKGPRFKFFQLEKALKESKIDLYGIATDLDAGVRVSISTKDSNKYLIQYNTWPKSEFASFSNKKDPFSLKIEQLFQQVQRDQVVLSLTGKRLMQIQAA